MKIYIFVPTCKETGHLLGLAVVCDSLACSAHFGQQGAERQQLPAVVPELVVDAQEARISREVAEVHRQLLLRAVHLAQVQERRQGVDLLSLVRHRAKIVFRISSSTHGRRSEDRDAAVWATWQTGVAGGDLCRRAQMTTVIVDCSVTVYTYACRSNYTIKPPTGTQSVTIPELGSRARSARSSRHS